VVFYSREGRFIEHMALSYLPFETCPYTVHSLQFCTPKLAICVHAAGICVCATDLNVQVLQTHTHKFMPETQNCMRKTLDLIYMEYIHIFYLFDYTHI
jgi:hypothetical protein